MGAQSPSPYSRLEWCTEPHSSWSLSSGRAASAKCIQTVQEVDAEQIRTLSESPTACREALDIVAADGQDRNSVFFRAVKGRAVGW